ncbi:hypothetical protein P154DRAFT_516855 [Amniculicola lignicola CBS 123094]|uniref:Uncharacterized protein n=1 Tax=Amniculicola lignicola CBS 123094 TaxID=1392246 RepID=A0A6A5X5H3_9PLEO|nr:hypothetical protein P154DRAFT_516855 [Amniculicola lignicola CBS 123094]
MSPPFALAHIPTLFVATAVTFGSMIPLFNAEWAITHLGLPRRVAVSKEAQTMMIFGTARATVIGASMLVFYYQGKLVEVDTVMVLLGAYVGAVDAYVCWLEGVQDKTVFRGVSGALIAAWGWFGMTAGA